MSSVKIPDEMAQNPVLDYLESCGYAVSALRKAGVLYDYNYMSYLLPEAYRTGLPYGDTGLVCASYVANYLFDYLPNHEAINTSMLTESFSGNFASVPDLYQLLDSTAQNYAYYDPNHDNELRVIKSTTPSKPGDIIFYGDAQHCAIYLGTADLVDSFSGTVVEKNAQFISHCGTDRGPEITTNRELENCGLTPTAVFSLEWNPNVAYFYLTDSDERAAAPRAASTAVIARKYTWSLGGDVSFQYWSHYPDLHPIFQNGSINNCVYFELQNGAMAYCLEPWVMDSGTGGASFHEVGWSDAVYNNDTVKYNTVRKILALGAHNTSAPEAEKKATALFVWDAICGYWTSDIKRTGIGEPPFLSTLARGTPIRDAYEKISTRIQEHQKTPSFATRNPNPGPANTVTLKHNQSTGYYEAVIYDSNAVVHDYKFQAAGISGLTFEIRPWVAGKGYEVRIKATEAAARQISNKPNGVVAKATGYCYDFPKQSIQVWASYDTSIQKFGSLANHNVQPVAAYIKILTDYKNDVAFSLKKTIKASSDIISQLQGNKCYTLAGAEYSVYKGGTLQEVMKTDVQGNAQSGKKYPVGTVLMVKETKAPNGFKLDPTTYTITIKESGNVLNVADEPAFDPRSIMFEKKDPITGQTAPQGNASFEGAVFKWEYFDNQDWSGTPLRTWYFATDKLGVHFYHPQYLANGYSNDALYKDNRGIARVPIGSVKITEVKAPAGYGQIQTLYANITQPSNGGIARFKWTAESAKIVESKDGNYLFPEPVNPASYGSVSIQKTDALTGGGAPAGADFAGCEFTIYNNSANPVKIGNHLAAAPGEACYVMTVNKDGKASSGAVFPIGKYTIKETKGNAYYQCNTEWSQTFEIISGGNTAMSFTAANTPITGHIQLTKVDGTDGKLLTGAVFQVTFPDGSTQNMVEGENGVHSLRDLRYGRYKVQEIKAPEGFQLDSTVYTVDITENGKVYEIQTPGHNGVANAPVPGSLSVQKADTQGNTMEGVTFLLEYSLDDGNTWQPIQSRADTEPLIPGTSSTQGIVDGKVTTDANGRIAFEGLRINSQTGNIRYRLTEIATTNGHTLLAGTAFDGFLPQNNLVDIQIHATNGTSFELPVSGSHGMQTVTTIGAVLLLTAALIPAFNKKQEEK